MIKVLIQIIFFVFLSVGLAYVSMADSMVLIKSQKSKDQTTDVSIPTEPFYMDKFEVSIADYRDFLEDTALKGFEGYRKPREKDLVKAANRIHWFEAQHFCHWKKKRLPTEGEWVLAAGGIQRKYPWGNQSVNGKRANHCDVNCPAPWSNIKTNDRFKRMAPVGTYPLGNTPEGLSDMAGNLWEWTATAYKTGETLPWKGKQHTQEEMTFEMVIKGGSYGSKEHQFENKERSKASASFRSSHIGFRCVKDIEPDTLPKKP